MNKCRLDYIDWLRSLVILSLVPYHAALTYIGLGDIYIREVATGLDAVPFIFLTMPLDNFFMTLLFFISGVSTFYSMKSKDNYSYLKERLKKLLLPFLLGTIFLCPLQAYAMALYNGFIGNVLQFIPIFFSAKIVEYLGYAHLWYLLYLFILTLFCTRVFRWLLNHSTKLKDITEWAIRKNNIYLPLLWIIIIEAILRPYFPGKQTFIFDWANVLIYLSVIT